MPRSKPGRNDETRKASASATSTGRKHKQRGKKGNGDISDDPLASIDGMPLASAVLNDDAEALGRIVASSLPNKNADARILSVEKSAGEAFTGGRSNPVYHVRTRVDVAGSSRDRRFVVKLVAVPAGDEVKRESYAVERRFYEHVAPRLRERSIAVPKLLASDNGPDGGPPSTSLFCWLMTDVRVQFPLHPAALDPRGEDGHCLWSAIDWLARFHALHWKDPAGGWRRSLWDRGGFWNKGFDFSGGGNDGSGLSAKWLLTCQWMSAKHGDMAGSPGIRTMGTRMNALHGPLSRFMAGQSKTTGSTLIHGDFKAANLFFCGGADGGDGAACAVDFQYSGAGLPAEDVAYLLFPDALIDYWDDEPRILEFYHKRLAGALVTANRGGPSSLHFERFCALYQLSRIELLIYWVHKGWVGSTDGDAKLVLAVEGALQKIDGGSVLPDEAGYQRALYRFLDLP